MKLSKKTQNKNYGEHIEGIPVVSDYNYLGMLGTNACNNMPHIDIIKKKCKLITGNICKVAN